MTLNCMAINWAHWDQFQAGFNIIQLLVKEKLYIETTNIQTRSFPIILIGFFVLIVTNSALS